MKIDPKWHIRASLCIAITNCSGLVACSREEATVAEPVQPAQQAAPLIVDKGYPFSSTWHKM